MEGVCIDVDGYGVLGCLQGEGVDCIGGVQLDGC